MNGAELILKTLVANGVGACFANPGTSEMAFVDAASRVPELPIVLALFEGVASGAADGYARVSGRPAATLLHLGPGYANAMANLHNARRAQTPVVNIVGEHASYHIQYDAPLTTDIESLARPMSNWVRRIKSPDDVSEAAAAAVAAARTEPGRIATLILPADAAWGQASAPVSRAQPPAPGSVDEATLQQAREALLNGRRTIILLSGKALRAASDLVAALLVGGFLGYWVDKWLHTLPLFLIIFFFLGFGAGFLNIYRAQMGDSTAKKLNNDDKKTDKEEK